MALHKGCRGYAQLEAEAKFIDLAMKQPFYGTELFPSKDSSGRVVEVGVNTKGITVYRVREKVVAFNWGIIRSIQFKLKRFQVSIKSTTPGAADEVHHYDLQNKAQCKVGRFPSPSRQAPWPQHPVPCGLFVSFSR